jgi:sorbitol/mannitol transport system permease protein
MNKKVPIISKILVFTLAILFFFPIFWMLLCGFKEEVDVVNPSIFFSPTMKHYFDIASGDILHYIKNSIIVTFSSILLALVLGVPVAYALVVGKFRNNGDNLFMFFLSTIILPPACVIVPFFTIFSRLRILDNHLALVTVYSVFNVPIVIWMMRSFFSDIPKSLFESARIDGSSELSIFFKLVLPLSRNGLSATILLVFIFIWNEFFFARSLTYYHAATLPIHMASFMTQQGLFWAKMCAVATIATIPPLYVGWANQKQLTRGLTMGAVKG